MHKLFTKIFVAFWLAMSLISAIGIVLALTTDFGNEGHEQRQRRYRLNSHELINAYEDGGVRAYRSKVREQDSKWKNWRFLYRQNLGTVDGTPLPTEIDALARLAEQTQVTQVHSGDTYIWVAYPATLDYTYVVKKVRPGRVERLLGLKDLGLRMVITFIVAGITCYLLARSLSSPIAKLRSATYELAEGHLSTRVSDTISGKDEIAGLARDFDLMAERIEGLVNTQHRMVRDISHELRSPLTRLNIAVELVRQARPDEPSELLDRIERESARLNDLIGHMLTLSMLEKASHTVAKTPIELKEFIAEIIRDAEFEATNSGRHVRFVAEGPVTVEASGEFLRQAIENVVRNAIRCTAEGSTVTIDLKSTGDSAQTSAVISVRDNGPGVPEDVLHKMFLPFYRAEESRDRRSGGCGLGLAITQRAVSLHGGSVKAFNIPDGGLQVSIMLPLQQPA